jgi:hypothetical protein
VLEPSLGTMNLRLAHRHYETFDLEWHCGERTLTVTAPGSPPLDLVPLGGLRFRVKDQPSVTAEFELDGDGAVTRLVAQPLGILLPREATRP